MRIAPTALIIGEGSHLTPCVKAMGFRPVVVSVNHKAAKKLEKLSPLFVVVDLPNGEIDTLDLGELSSSGTPIFILADPATPPHGVVEGDPNIHVVSRSATSSSNLETAIRNTVQTVNGSGRFSTTQVRFSPEYLRDYAPLLSHSAKMVVVKETIEKVADTNATVLLRGETGVGKDVVARAVHAASGRHHRPFVKLNCAALPAELLESELFGHEKGAFTGAHRRKLGKFEFANQGTIFLDEIGELPLSLQAKLLHVLEDLQFSRIGGREMIKVDTRIVAATNRNLEAALGRGEFREDLFYRLSVVEIHVPPLRERRDEILPLVSVFLGTFNREYRRQVDLSPRLADLFMEYEWPGNVRELENAVRRLVVLSNPDQIDQEIRTRRRMMAVPKEAAVLKEAAGPPGPAAARDEAEDGLKAIARRAAQEAERKALTAVLHRVHWNRLEAARILKVSYKTLLTKITECELDTAPSRRS